jgi:hypothetical protein
MVLVGLDIRTLGQEKELARRRAVSLARQELLTRLEGVKLRAAGGRVSPGDGAVAGDGGALTGRRGLMES